MSLLRELLGKFGRKAAGAAKTAENIVGPVAGLQKRLEQAEKLIPDRRAAQIAEDQKNYPGWPSGGLRLASRNSTVEHHVLAARQMDSAFASAGGLSQAVADHGYDAYKDLEKSRKAFEADPHNADLLANLKDRMGQLVEVNERAPAGAKVDWSKTGGGSSPFTSEEIDSMRPGYIERNRDYHNANNDLIADQRLHFTKPVAEGEEQSTEIDFTRTIGYSGGIDPERVTLEEKEIAEYKARKRTFVDKGREERADDLTTSEPYYDRMNPSLKPGEDPQEGGTYGLRVRQNYQLEGKHGPDFGYDDYEEEYGYYRDGRDGKVFDATDTVQHGERQAVGGDLDTGGEFVERDSAGNAYPKPYRIAKQEADPGAGATPPPQKPPTPPSPAAAPTSPGPAASTPASGPVNPVPPPTPQQAASSSAGASSTPPPPTPPSAPSSNPVSGIIDQILTRKAPEASDIRSIASSMGGALDPLLIGAAGGAIGFAHGAMTYNEEEERDPDFKNAPGIGRLNNALMGGAAGALKGVAYGAGLTAVRAIGGISVGSVEGAASGLGVLGSIASGTATGAAAGAVAGSVVPGIGTGIGGLLGGLSGAVGGLASSLGSASVTGSFVEGFGEAFIGKGIGALRSGGGDFTEKAAGASDIINKSLFARTLNSTKGLQSEISTLEGRLAGDLSEDAIDQMKGYGLDDEVAETTKLRASTEKLLGEKRKAAERNLPDAMQDQLKSKPVALGMRDLPGIAGGLGGYIAGTAAALPITAYRAWRSGIAAPYYGYEDYSDRSAGRQFVGEVFQNSAWRGTIKPALESVAGPMMEGEPGAVRQIGGGTLGGIVGGMLGGAVAGPLGAVAGAGIGGRLTAGVIDRAAINIASGSEAPKSAAKSILGRIKTADTPAGASATADSLFNPTANLVLGVGLTGAIASTVAGALPNAFMAGAEISSSGAPMGHPMNALRNRKDPVAQSRAQMEADQSNKVRMTNPGMIGLSDIEEPYHTNTSFKPTRGKHTPGKYNDTGDLVFALSALRRG
jgi:hypothetical protein